MGRHPRAVREQGKCRVAVSRNGDNIGAAFPEIVGNQNFKGILDGELLVKHGELVASFSDLQQRLNRKTVTPALLKKYPAHIRLYDALELDGEDLRPLSFDERRKRLELWHGGKPPHHTDLSPLVFPASKEDLREMWNRRATPASKA